MRDTLRDNGKRGVVVETLGEADQQSASGSHGTVDFQGASGGRSGRSPAALRAAPGNGYSLPLYPWQHTPFIVETTREGGTIFEPPTHPLLGRRLRSDSHEWFSTVDPMLFPWLNDHKVSGVLVFPATAFIEVMLAAGQQIHGDAVLELRDLDIVQPLIFDGKSCFETLVKIESRDGHHRVPFARAWRCAGMERSTSGV